MSFGALQGMPLLRAIGKQRRDSAEENSSPRPGVAAIQSSCFAVQGYVLDINPHFRYSVVALHQRVRARNSTGECLSLTEASSSIAHAGQVARVWFG